MQTIRTYRYADNSQAANRFGLNLVAMGHECCVHSAVEHSCPPVVSVPVSSVPARSVSKPATLKPTWVDPMPVDSPARAWAALVIGRALSS